MKKLLFIMLLAGTGVCAAQRHPYNSRPYHRPDRPSIPRETRRPQPAPPTVTNAKPTPVVVPSSQSAKRGK